jgi:hypothetical protein
VHVDGLRTLSTKCRELGMPFPVPVEAKILEKDLERKTWRAQWKVMFYVVGL